MSCGDSAGSDASRPGTLELGRLRWSCRRGMRELDELLTRYLDARYRQAPPAEQRAFRELLDGPDALIYAYCLGQQVAPTADLAALIAKITAGGPYEQ
jgi:antitoxin CptB